MPGVRRTPIVVHAEKGRVHRHPEQEPAGASDMIGALSPRRIEALKLDLEDRQNCLIEDIYQLSRGLLNRVRVPEAFARELRREDCRTPIAEAESGRAEALVAEVEELHRVNRTLGRLQRSDFGRCRGCGAPIDFSRLAADPTRDRCESCVAEPVPG
jgi:RNA polymerase-binding transcription factor DksA